MELKGKLEKFCWAYVFETNENATAAAKIAGYSERSARTLGSRWLAKVDVQRRIRELRYEAVRESGYDPEKVKAALASRLFAISMTEVTDVVNVSPHEEDPNREAVLDALAVANGGQRVLDFGGVLIAPTVNLPAHAKAAIKSIKSKVEKGCFVGIDVEMHDPITASRTLAQMLGIGMSDVTVNVDIQERMERARKRVARHARGEPAEGGNDDS